VENLSFSSIVKNELCRIEPRKNCCPIYELVGVIKNGSFVKIVDNVIIIRITTENAGFARRFFSISKSICNINPKVVIRRNIKLKKHIVYIIETNILKSNKQLIKMLHLYKNLSEEFLSDKKNRICCKKAYLRGAFLSSGSVSDPEKTYHLEITNSNLENANELSLFINSFGINSKIIKRKSYYVVYLKEGENIVDFLNIIGAHNSLMDLENIRILKDVRNTVNRIVNCETANLEKTVEASLRQIENIKYIRDYIGFNKLTKNLREAAELRLDHAEANLKELGQFFDPPLGKSGVNHRLLKLDKMANEYRRKRGDI
jgi:cell division protein WhiA